MASNAFERGSEWRKWDLHIHTPGTMKNDQFGSGESVWDEYIKKLEESDIAVFGITDYFSINNYLKVREYQQKKGRLTGKTIFPNIELRILPVTGEGRPINIHVVLDPSIEEEQIEREFFGGLKVGGLNNYSCRRDDLIAYGKQLENNDRLDEDIAIKKAIEKTSISFDNLKEVIEKISFRDKILVATSSSSNDGVSGLKADGTLATVKQEILRITDIILSGNEKDRVYFLGKGNDSKDEVIKNYRTLKPCITCSDAHKMEDVGKFHNNKITWIKADPTFEGLKQIIYEPEDRVTISELKPETKSNYNIIDSVELNEEGIWKQDISFNENLNVIIGGRATGKSTLLEAIASKYDVNINSDEGRKVFILNLSKNIKINWKEGNEEDNKAIEFFPQNKISQICECDDEINDIVEKAIFDENPEYQNKYNLYLSKKEQISSKIRNDLDSYKSCERQLVEKVDYLKSYGDENAVQNEIARLDALMKEIPSINKEDMKLIDIFQKSELNLQKLNENIRGKEQEIASVKNLINEDFVTTNNISLAGLSEESQKKISESVMKAIGQANEAVIRTINALREKINESIEGDKKRIKDIQESEDYKNGKKYCENNKSIVEITGKINDLKVNSEKIRKLKDERNGIKEKSQQLESEIIKLHLSFLRQTKDIAQQLNMCKDGINVNTSVELDESFGDFLSMHLFLRGSAMQKFISEVEDTYKRGLEEDIESNKIIQFVEKVRDDKIKFKGGCDKDTFLTDFLSRCWFKLRHDVEYECDRLGQMSPGKRSFVLLKFILDISKRECPILIDQPEDNLDNRAIYNELVKYLRTKKMERQIILVTHNPNVVVGADAEEVIVANQNGKDSPNDNHIKFQYVTGSLENSLPREKNTTKPVLLRCGIREHVCEVLEGGEEAFRIRENKYGIENNKRNNR